MSDAQRMDPPTYGRSELEEFAERGMKEARAYADGRGASGVALPDWTTLQPCAIMSAQWARRLGAQLILAADEHDAIADAAIEQFSSAARGERTAGRASALRSALNARVAGVVDDEDDRNALLLDVHELADLAGA
jgi:hypothetical protein